MLLESYSSLHFRISFPGLELDPLPVAKKNRFSVELGEKQRNQRRSLLCLIG